MASAPITALAMSVGAAVVGSAFGPTNPFQTGIALRFAEMPPLSQPGLRFGLLRRRGRGVDRLDAGDDVARRRAPRVDRRAAAPGQRRVATAVLLAIVLCPFIPYVIGVLRFDWGFNELSALFLVAGFAVGLVSGRSLSDTRRGFLKGMEAMLAAATLRRRGPRHQRGADRRPGARHHRPWPSDATGRSPRRIRGRRCMIPDARGAAHPRAIGERPGGADDADHGAAVGPARLSRDAAVIAYQTGAGLMDMITPTNGALLAMLLGAGVTYGRWLRFALPGRAAGRDRRLAGIALAG